MRNGNAQPAWDETVDFLVVGSGAAGMAGALTASTRGLSVLVVEKESQYGGTTALSGGVMWIPNNTPMRSAGLEDSPEAALTYLQHNIGNRVGRAKLETFVDAAPKMLDLLRSRGFLEVEVFEGFPDYRPETPGSVQQGRSVEPRVFAGRRLGQELAYLRRRAALAPGGLVGTMSELRRMAAIRSNTTPSASSVRHRSPASESSFAPALSSAAGLPFARSCSDVAEPSITTGRSSSESLSA